jgi:hypothetical protein
MAGKTPQYLESMREAAADLAKSDRPLPALARTGISQLLGSKIIRRFTQYRMIGWTGGS